MGHRYYPSKVFLWTEILEDGPDSAVVATLPTTEFQSSFSLNTIPAASVTLATGVNAAAPNQKAGIHGRTLEKLRGAYTRIRCRLEGEAGVLDGQVVKWPEDDFIVFEGRISGTGMQIGGGLASTLAIEHWLIDLNNTNWASCVLDEHSPDSVMRSAGFNRSTVVERVGGTSLTLDDRLVLDNKLNSTNWWRDDFKKLLEMAATSPVPSINKAWLTAVNIKNPDTPNINAVRALSRMDNPAFMVIPEMVLFGRGAEQVTFGSGMFINVVKMANVMMFGNNDTPTLWSKILRILPHFGCVLVPNVKTATVVPFAPVLDKVWMTLNSSELWSVKTDTRLDRALSGIALIARSGPSWGSPTPTNPAARQPGDGVNSGSGYVGLYRPREIDAKDNKGSIGVRMAPTWLDPQCSVRYTPPKPALNVNNPNRENKAVNDLDQNRIIGDRLAKWMFMNEVYQTRRGIVGTRLRFDICPGSMIRFRGSDPEYDVVGFSSKEMYANVMGVTTTITAKAPQCTTQLELSHLRMADEDELFLSDNPLYPNKYWRGSPLVYLDGLTPKLRT